MTKTHIFSDFDGTITENDTLIFLTTHLGGGAKLIETIGRLLHDNTLSLSEGIAAEMRSIRRPFAEAEKLLREKVKIDPGFVPFARWCEARQIPLTVLSAGFYQLIELFLQREEFPQMEILANHLKPNEQIGWQCVFRDKTPDGHDKSVAVRQARSRGINPIDNPGWQAIYAEAARPFAPARGETVAVAAALPAHGEVDAISARQWQAIADVFGDGPQAVLNDVDGAQIGAFAGGPGILILSGTGSMAWARDLEGRSHRVGGWGDIIGDEGSAYWIGRRLLGVVAQSLDGRGGPTGLVNGLFDLLGLDRSHPADGLESWIAHLTHSRSQIAALTPVVTRLAEAGDATALEDRQGEACVRGCYRCLLSYFNQPDHEMIDRTRAETKQMLVEALEKFVRLPPSVLEMREKLEQLRAIEAGMRIDPPVSDPSAM